jgi:hypothetical protein
MTRIQTMWAALYATALSMWAVPVLALAQTQGRAPAGTAPGDTTTTNSGGGAGWLWIIAALVVLAIIWWAMTSRRRGNMTRTHV